MQIFLMALLLFSVTDDPAQIRYDDFFLDKALRVDVHQFGTVDQERICIDELILEPTYAGPRKKLIDPRKYGSHFFKVYDLDSGRLIFSRGFCTLFGEWKTTKEAREGIYRVFEHTLIMPFPRKDIRISISCRNRDNSFREILNQTLNLSDSNIRSDNPNVRLEKIKLLYNGDPESKVDIVILGDGYTGNEMDRYLSDAREAMDELFSEDPFKEQLERFNVWAVKSPSPETGIDEPRKGISKATLLDVSFNTFNLDRYAMTHSVKKVRDVAACAPYDFIIIIFNSSRYGGGGIYHLYAMVTGNHARKGVLPHEMGHCMAALGDEYVDSSVAYIDFFPDGIEPWEPNLTALIDGNPPKWVEMIPEGTPVPTPPKRTHFGSVGCFEGAGYKAKGLYRPSFDCIMRSCRNGFCPVCSEAIMETIRFYSE